MSLKPHWDPTASLTVCKVSDLILNDSKVDCVNASRCADTLCLLAPYHLQHPDCINLVPKLSEGDRLIWAPFTSVAQNGANAKDSPPEQDGEHLTVQFTKVGGSDEAIEN